ncbi:hypothetical protein SAMN06295912_13521 [Sphingomonas laterariae]|uniref:Uncharacterized protein n=1 Tax=Edaphosphingomonas laterariae TaxID=861865 RepID=A0A239JIJ6_9SPHN|nr:hypothetical protein SAMN06295912_13521 [Sphingomonas laterariae]
MTRKITIETDDFGKRWHVFPLGDGGWKRCGGPKFCRECNREAVRREAMRRPI